MNTRALVLVLMLFPLTRVEAQAPVPHARDRVRAVKTPVGGCTVQNNNTATTLEPGANGDALFKLLSAEERCPQNALIFRDLVEKKGMTLHPTMVANRGYSNPLPQGSFSFFEAITGTYGEQELAFGDWFFGHFTAASIDNTASTSTLSPQQAATPDSLLLETIIWDPKKGVFNFYEIRGTGQGGVWFYRGDSNDILLDTKNLYRNTDPTQPIFSGPQSVGGLPTTPRLRCSGCHMNGGPIMKELKSPHDSWWTTQRPLLLGGMRIAPEFKPIFENLVTADKLEQWVKAANAKLLASAPYWKDRSALSLQEQLRPLFCEQEVNLDSDDAPFDSPLATIKAPVGFFVDQRLVPDVAAVTINKSLYTNALTAFQSAFIDYQSGSIANAVQPINQSDADHAFETPVKSHSDMALVQKMIDAGLIDETFVFNVISVDMTRPMFSAARCSLLRLLPTQASSDWRKQFEKNLVASSNPAAKELLASLKDPLRTPAYHRKPAADLIAKVQAKAAQQNAVSGYVRLLAGRRIAVFQAEISQHPNGQIFEPGFRLIFPTMQLFQKDQQQIGYGGVPGQYWLNPSSALVELAP